jgi:2-haloacid dehalogenase
MITCIIFDLSEVIIAGLIGVEQALSREHGLEPQRILEHFGGEHLDKLCRGECSEAEYLSAVRAVAGWQLPDEALQHAIRKNFARRIQGMPELVERLAKTHELVLLSDHGREWVEHIEQIHPFLQTFSRRVFSFQTGLLKNSPAAFEKLLQDIARNPTNCLFIDDNPRNVENARKAGIAAVHFVGVSQLETELTRLGVI